MSFSEITDLLKQSRYQEALEAFDQLPDDLVMTADGIWLKSSCLLMTTGYRQAQALLDRGIELYPDSVPIKINQLRNLFMQGDIENGINEILAAPELLTTSAALTLEFLYSITKHGRGDLLQYAEEAVQQHQGEPAILMVVGFSMWAAGNFNQANQFFSHAIRGEPPLSLSKIDYFDFLGQVFASQKTILEACHAIAGKEANEQAVALCMYHLARRMDATKNLESFEDIPEQGVHFEKIPVQEHPTRDSMLIFERSRTQEFLPPPPLSHNLAVKGIGSLQEIVQHQIGSGCYDTQLNNIRAIRQRFSPETADPIFVMSTGRCGTRSLYQLLETSEHVLPYHSFTAQMPAADRNHLLYRVLTNKFDDETINQLMINYLQARTAELMYAYRQGRRPVFVSHLDTVYHPVNRVFFPEGKTLYLHRNDLEVFQSIHKKNQFLDLQLMPLRFDARFPENRFLYSLDCGMEQPERIAWYLAATECYAKAALEVNPDNSLDSNANELFTGDQDAIVSLADFLNIPDLPAGKIKQHFSKRINIKAEKADINEANLSAASKVAEASIGRFLAN